MRRASTTAPLQPGRYEVSAELPGFQRYSQKGITLELGRVARIDITLQVGHVSESVDVVAENQLIESETATVGQFIENKTVRDMPINGRRVGDLLKLMGNAVYISGDVIRPRVTVAGSRGDQQQWLLDGVNASNVALEIPQALFNPPVESVQEVRVQQNNYSAEFGNTAGGVVSVITRSGTNQFHGSAYEFFRNDAMDARNFFSAQKAPLRYNIFGLTAGGPIIKNKTFFFSSNEWQIQRIGLTRVYTVPTAAQKAGDFSQTLTAAGALVPIYDPATTRADPANPARTIRDPFVGNIIPSNRLDPVGAKIAGYYPAATRAAANLAGANNFARNGSTNLNLTTWTTKVDHLLNDNSRLGFRMVLHNFPTDTAATFDNPAADPDGSITTRRAYSFLGTYTRNFGSRAVNDLRFNYQPRRFRQDTLSIGGNWPAQLGLKGVTGSAFPQVTASGYVTLGRARSSASRPDPGYGHRGCIQPAAGQALDQDWRRGAVRPEPGRPQQPDFGFDRVRSATDGSFGHDQRRQRDCEPAAGHGSSGKIQDTDILNRHAAYYAAFVQDDWKVTRSFTLNVGVRWETHTPRVDANNRQNSFDTTKINPVSGTPGVVTFAGRDGLGSKVYNSDYVNFGPRIGFAWKPSERRSLVVRSGYGVYFGPPCPGRIQPVPGLRPAVTTVRRTAATRLRSC